MPNNLISCPGCRKELLTIDYKMWGTKRFDSKIGSYEEDEGLGMCDLEFTCPHCEAKLDPDNVLA